MRVGVISTPHRSWNESRRWSMTLSSIGNIRARHTRLRQVPWVFPIITASSKTSPNSFRVLPTINIITSDVYTTNSELSFPGICRADNNRATKEPKLTKPSQRWLATPTSAFELVRHPPILCLRPRETSNAVQYVQIYRNFGYSLTNSTVIVPDLQLIGHFSHWGP